MGLANSSLFLNGKKRLVNFVLCRLRWVSIILFTTGIAWMFVLPLDEFSRNTYISENALLPGQVHTYFGGSDYKVLNAFRNEIRLWVATHDQETRLSGMELIFRAAGLQYARQHYNVEDSRANLSGTNLYAILAAPRGDATESIVVTASWVDTSTGVINEGGVAMVLALARYMKRWSLWSRDIIFLISDDRQLGAQVWVDAYHETHDPRLIDSLPVKAGAIQAAIAVDFYGSENRFNFINLNYEGTNGQLANLDLINTVVHIAKKQMGIDVYTQQIDPNPDRYFDRLRTVIKAMMKQATGLSSGSHSAFIPYKIDSVSLWICGTPDGRHDDSALGRTIESTLRSLNNILEHLHQSFFFYMMITPTRFVSVATYLPSAILVSLCFTVMGSGLYVEWQNLPSLHCNTKAFIIPLIIIVLVHMAGLTWFYGFLHVARSRKEVLDSAIARIYSLFRFWGL